jgi:Zn-dependent protease
MGWLPNKDSGDKKASNGSGGDNVYRLPPRQRPQQDWPISGSFLGLCFAFLMLAGIMLFAPQYARGAVFPFVLGGWLISLCLHEYGHAVVAYHYGDWTVKDKGYLTLDPVKYTDPMNSIFLPILFLAMGGIGLPGGAVYIQRSLLRKSWHDAAVSAAGPFANFVTLIALALLLNVFSEALAQAPILRASLAFLALLQLTSMFFNMLPVPGVDGWGMIEPWLPQDVRDIGRRWAPVGPMLLILVFMVVPGVSSTFFDAIYGLMSLFGVSGGHAFQGLRLFQFWR